VAPVALSSTPAASSQGHRRERHRLRKAAHDAHAPGLIARLALNVAAVICQLRSQADELSLGPVLDAQIRPARAQVGEMLESAMAAREKDDAAGVKLAQEFLDLGAQLAQPLGLGLLVDVMLHGVPFKAAPGAEMRADPRR
jgi:hypothetical protein